MDHANTNLIVTNSAQHSQNANNTSQPRTILEEEEYTSTLSHIVTRDYFPSLHSLRRDAAILDARSRGDISGAVAVRRRARKEEMERVKEREEELEAEEEAESETALVPQHDGNGNGNGNGNGSTNGGEIIQVRKRPRPLKHESISGFHARVTSEDNAEFESNQEREAKEREEILGVVYASRADKEGRLMIEACINNNNGQGTDETKKSSKNTNYARALLGCDTPIGLSSDLYDAPPSAGLRITNSGNDATNDNENVGKSNNGIGRNGLFFQPQHRSRNNNNQAANSSSGYRMLTTAPSGGTFLSLENGAACDAGTKSITNSDQEGSNLKSDNLLMPPPPARATASSGSVVPFAQNSEVGSSTERSSAKSTPVIDNRCQLVEYLPKPALADIHPPATRFPYQNESRLLAIGSNSISTHGGSRSAQRTSFGSCYSGASDTTDLDASPPPLDMERAAHQKARLREHETFVAMTPLIQPGGGSGRLGGEKAAIESSEEPIMTWGDVASTPLVLGSGTAVDGRSSSSADWEPTRPASLSSSVDVSGSSLPAFDVADEGGRETMARRAEKGLLVRAKTYRAAGSKERSKSVKESDDESVQSSWSISSSATPLDRTASLTPAARALLEASKNARQSRKKSGSRSSRSSSSSRIFQNPASSSRSSNAAKNHAGSRDSFGSALRMSYTPNATPRSGKEGGGRKRKGSSSSMRRAAGGATPVCHSLR